MDCNALNSVIIEKEKKLKQQQEELALEKGQMEFLPKELRENVNILEKEIQQIEEEYAAKKKDSKEKIQKIESGSIIIYTYGISINEIIPISNYESKNDIIEYLQLIIPEIVSCQWRDLEIEQVIKTIEKYDRFDSFTEKKFIIS
jgi:hypothetical protein